MNRTVRPFRVLLLAALACLGLPAAHAAAADPGPPNIIVILADDLGGSDLGCYGSTFHRTPNLDRMAREGMLFTHARSAAPVCSPTRAALMTGKAPARLHLTDFIPGRNILPDQKLRRPDFEKALPLAEETLAERLKALGYHTGFMGKWHLGGKGFHAGEQGFDEFTADLAGARRIAPFGPGANPVPDLAPATDGEELTHALTRKAVTFLRTHKERPFLLYLAHVAVHIPLHGTPDRVSAFSARVKPGSPQTNAVYAAMLESLDESVGTVLQEVRNLGLDQRTLVVFTSDNGGLSVLEGPNTPATSNIPHREGKGHLYEGGLRVPLIIRWPGGIAKNGPSAQPVITMDLPATLLDAAGGLPAEGLADGKSLLPLLRGGDAPPPHPHFWHYPHYSNQGGRPSGAMLEGPMKLVEFYESGYLELYDLDRDPSEARNLAGDKPEVANRMAAALAAWRKSVGAQSPVANTNHVVVPSRPGAGGGFVLPAHEATVHGVNLRYEPPAHKNTLGYWTRVEDWASWDIEVRTPGRYRLGVLQGCGKGSGGSEVDMRIAGQTVAFTVQDTGHFQNFVQREIGEITLEAGRHTLEVRPRKKPGVAVMDLRKVTLTPQ